MSNGTLTDAQLSEILGEDLYSELQPYMGEGSQAISGLFDWLSSNASNIAGTAGGLAMFNQMSDLGKEVERKALGIGERAQADTAFRPFTVSTGFGGVSATPEGGFTTALSPYGKRFQRGARGITSGLMRDFGEGVPDVSGLTSAAFGGIPGLLEAATGDTAAREADIYSRIRATQTPEEERQALALEQRLAAQGRTGLRTAQFGGSPEQLALAKAREEAMLSANLGAMDQARAEQMQQLGMAQGMFGLGSGAAALPSSLRSAELGNLSASLGLSYMPEQQLLSTLTPALSLADLVSTGQRQGAGYLAEAGMAGLAGRTEAEKSRIEAISSLLNTLNQPQGGTGGEGGSGFNPVGFLLSQFGIG